MKKAKYLIISLVIIVSLLLGSGCQLLPDINISPTTSPSPSTQTPTPINPTWTPSNTSNSTITLPDIASVVAKVRPSVVAINTEVTSYDIFNRPFTQQGAGSGWIIDEIGIIVTNNHVIEGAETITVTLVDGRTFTPDMNKVTADALSDLAVLKIDASGLTAMAVGDSPRLRVGNWVIAIGNSLGEGISATSGIVSALGVSLPVSGDQTLYDLIQTDAAINPGNSGGPLVNLAGEVIGITSAKIASVGVEGMGYAISTHTALPIIGELIQSGYVVRPWLGVSLYTVDQYAVFRYGLSVNTGALITSVVPGSPAADAGLQEGDVIVSLAGRDIANTEELLQIIHSSQISQEVEITYWRGDTRNTTSANLIESPAP